MSEYSQYYNNFASVPSRWSHTDPDRCGCRGGGWFLSEVDTWHQCPAHGLGVPHPEEVEAQLAYEDWQREHPAEAALMQAEWAARCEAALVQVEAWAFRDEEGDVPF